MITGLNHITLAVKDLERSFQFYSTILGFKPLLKWSEGAYFAVGNLWFCLQQDGQTRLHPLLEYTHIAFSVGNENFSSLAERIKRSGALIWKENKSEGNSLYFLDPDGHKLEIHVGDVHTRIASFKALNLKGYEFF